MKSFWKQTNGNERFFKTNKCQWNSFENRQMSVKYFEKQTNINKILLKTDKCQWNSFENSHHMSSPADSVALAQKRICVRRLLPPRWPEKSQNHYNGIRPSPCALAWSVIAIILNPINILFINILNIFPKINMVMINNILMLVCWNLRPKILAKTW